MNDQDQWVMVNGQETRSFRVVHLVEWPHLVFIEIGVQVVGIFDLMDYHPGGLQRVMSVVAPPHH